MDRIYNETEIRKEYSELTKRLIARGLTITTMESATAGQLASLITDTEGSSAVLKGAFITYSNEAKIMQGVPAETIEKFSVYSEETARAMAEVCRRTYFADIGIGVTGTMGNTDPANPSDSTPGEVFFAVALDKGTFSYTLEIPPQPSRLAYKLAVCGEILDALTSLGI